MVEFLKSKMSSHDIIHLQETHLAAYDFDYLSQELPYCELYYSNLPENTAVHAGTRRVCSPL